ncbi:unnamed protein product [Pleuronectes platessa]|uniref:Uncharacterized protein n=1 Tax=Pleuronectes platessa TaxID=8262 RepID=A0A9N7UQB7_PLEPL|nr:unnamed protein product [Pleuronectes platessa]
MGATRFSHLCPVNDEGCKGVLLPPPPNPPTSQEFPGGSSSSREKAADQKPLNSVEWKQQPRGEVSERRNQSFHVEEEEEVEVEEEEERGSDTSCRDAPAQLIESSPFPEMKLKKDPSGEI